MIYTDYKGKKLSALGLGAMRLPIFGDNVEDIDKEQVAKMVDYAMEKGINYYDTAWGYHNGKSELVMGECLSRYPRESYYLADKFPGYDLDLMDKVEEIFEAQLKKLKTDYFDFYLFHNLCEMNVEEYLDPKFRIYDYLMEQKRNGRIKHLGVSCHAGWDAFIKFMDAYGDDMEFCQLQLNYVDWDFQDVKRKVEYCNSRKIPIWVMEPLRGGSLVNLEDEYVQQLRSLRPEMGLPEWAFRYIQSVPGVKVILSGMSNFDQLQENIEIFSKENPLTEVEVQILYDIAADKVSKIAVPCTSCRYCTAHCPQQIDIPVMLEFYNEHCYTGGGFIAPMLMEAVPEERQPGACIGCGRCEKVCPQQIKISECMADFAKQMDGATYK